MNSGKDDAEPGLSRTTVFLSYSSEDRATAAAIVKALEAQGITVWWDDLIEGGGTFSDRIEGALQSADAVVVLWSARSIQSHWVRDEASHGRDRGRLVPVSIDGAEPPLGFRQVQTVDLRAWRGKPTAPQVVELCRSIRTIAGAPVPTSAPAVRHSAESRLSRRAALGVGGATVVAVGAGFAGWTLLPGKAQATNSVVILPFRNMSGDPAEDYFSDGLAEELRATLSRNPLLEVAAQTSSNRAGEKSSDPRSVAAALNVAFLLEGSVRRSADMLRITAQIVDGSSGIDKWAQSFDGKPSDILEVQSEVAVSVTDALLSRISNGNDALAKRLGGTGIAAAFDAYLRGVALYRMAGGEAQDRAALAQFDEAVKADANYAAAHAARSRALTVIANNYAPHDQLKAYYRRSTDAARTAIRIAPQLAEGHSALGFVLFNGELDAKAARFPYQQSFELGYGNADILSAYANFAARVGEFADGRKAIARAERLDPLNANVFRNAGLLEFAARDYGAAIGALHTALSLNPKSSTVHATLADIELVSGNIEKARAHYEREPDTISRLRGLAIADMRLSRVGDARNHLATLVRDHGAISGYQQAQVLAQWGEIDRAQAMLERALAAGDAGLVRSRNDPLLDPIRKTDRFAQIQRKLGFE